MRVIIRDKFYEFQNKTTEAIFNEQKTYLTELIRNHSESGELEELMTALFSLYNLSEALIHKAVEDNGPEKIIEALNAKTVD